MTNRELVNGLQKLGWQSENGNITGLVWKDPKSPGIYYLKDAAKLENISETPKKLATKWTSFDPKC